MTCRFVVSATPLACAAPPSRGGLTIRDTDLQTSVFHYDKKTTIAKAEYDIYDFGIRRHRAHPNTGMAETRDPVIDTPVIDVGVGSRVKIQCTLEGSPRSQTETESVPHEAERETEQWKQPQECEILFNRIKLRAFTKKVELVLVGEETQGAGLVMQKKVTVSHLLPASVYKIHIIQFSGNNRVWEVEQCISTKATEEKISYFFEMQTGCENFEGKPSERQQTLLKDEMLKNGNMVKSDGIPIYLVNASTTFEKGDISLKEIGKQAYNDIAETEKVILVLGQTGVGKTTWINTVFNYLLGVNYTDNFRFKLVIEENAEHQELSQTQSITIYRIHHKMGYNVDHTLTLIDTPGFGATEGIERDKGVAKHLQMIFDFHSGFVDRLNAVVFMAKSNQQRLDSCQKYIISSFTDLFGANIAENIYLVFTHAGIEEPKLFSSLQNTELHSKKYFQFDSATVFDDIEKIAKTNRIRKRLIENRENQRKDFYEATMDEFKEFFLEVKSTREKGLTATRNVLEIRMTLEQNITELNNLIRKGLDQMDQLKNAAMATTAFDDEIELTKDYTVTNQESVKKLVKKSGIRGTTICIECQHTCHRDCLIYFDFMKSICEVMDRSTTPPSCTKCEGKCPWGYHTNIKYVYENQLQSVQKTLFERKKRYEEAQAKKLTAEEVCNNIKKELNATETQMKAIFSEITGSIKELNKIGMKSDKISVVNYINILIAREEQIPRCGKQNKLALLLDLRNQAESMVDITKGDYDPFRIYREKAKQISAENPRIKGIDLWMNVSNSFKQQAAKQTRVVRRALVYFNALRDSTKEVE